MFKITLLFAIAVSVSYADLPVTPPPVLCGEMPPSIYRCLGRPMLLNGDSATECHRIYKNQPISRCEEYKCIFNQTGWFDGEKVDRAKVGAYFEQYAKEHPAWAPAVAHVKSACLAGALAAQGGYLDCPPYDVWLCILSGFIKNATPDQWSSAADCQYPRQFAAACPMCPAECFAPLVPTGSCNACVLLPRSP